MCHWCQIRPMMLGLLLMYRIFSNCVVIFYDDNAQQLFWRGGSSFQLWYKGLTACYTWASGQSLRQLMRGRILPISMEPCTPSVISLHYGKIEHLHIWEKWVCSHLTNSLTYYSPFWISWSVRDPNIWVRLSNCLLETWTFLFELLTSPCLLKKIFPAARGSKC